MNVLFASSEVFPLIKTGGLGDVAYSLPQALQTQGADVHLVLPAYRSVLQKVGSTRVVGWLYIQGSHGYYHTVRILSCEPEGFNCTVHLVDCPALFDRAGGPYNHPDGYDWPDNAERFTVFARAICELANDSLQIGWKADAIHLNDWQTGLVPALLEQYPHKPRTLFTIHNLAYIGYFPRETFDHLGLSWHWWSAEGMEFHQGFSMLKAGIVYADTVTTVSPTYAREICTPEFGYGLDGLLRSRHYKLHGILNGIDNHVWNPQTDPYLTKNYTADTVTKGKQASKQALLKYFGVTDKVALKQPLFGLVSRLVEQKGIDLVIQAIQVMLRDTDARFCLIGSGQGYYEGRLRELAAQHPERVMVYIGYNEELAHQLEAGVDMFLMPSRFEPCGLNQMYSLNYGTPPIVYFTGGLADTVVNSTPTTLLEQQATGFVFYDISWSALLNTMLHACDLYHHPKVWLGIQQAGMRQDFSWAKSAARYLALY
ncbi:glycogen synthase GlgA [Thiofilum flexile]|uniref:glycogen synthase GlgA n=1 Tax=Thiofilum flexile TaxID=125627 RepID=UPI00037701D7|nr:glycogen synthase GlgA [Thiofilum flexile]